MVGTVSGMAFRASTGYRRVHHLFFKGLALVAGKTKLILRLGEKMRLLAVVRIVADKAIALFHRRMRHLALARIRLHFPVASKAEVRSRFLEINAADQPVGPMACHALVFLYRCVHIARVEPALVLRMAVQTGFFSGSGPG